MIFNGRIKLERISFQNHVVKEHVEECDQDSILYAKEEVDLKSTDADTDTIGHDNTPMSKIIRDGHVRGYVIFLYNICKFVTKY